MRKTDKKREHTIVKSLTAVCDTAQREFEGFAWLTHLVDYDRYPESLQVICVFKHQQPAHDTQRLLSERVVQALGAVGISLRPTQVICITEAQWQRRNQTH